MDTPHKSGDTYRVYTLRHGTRETTRAHVFLDYASYGEPDGPHTVDYYFWVLQSAQRVIVVDTGFDADVARRRDRVVLHDPIDMLRTTLGVDAKDVDTVIVTHCHYDHIGNLSRFPNAHVYIAEAELDFATSGALDKPLVGHFTEPEEVSRLIGLRREGRLSAISEDKTIAPGVRLLPVGGHTPGQLMVEADTADGVVLLASDALHFSEELERDMPFISSMDLPATYEVFDLIRRRLNDGVAHVVPGHDARALVTMTPVTTDIGVLG
ncbi:N-acyl homoserine lactonase family protein [Microbacterium sp. 22215]|uniref:N-acyl homoserine lactonase family protein n=1 Tax=Microbacterium sp. 22215 TaxID=3453893 RepID=UPI003F865685